MERSIPGRRMIESRPVDRIATRRLPDEVGHGLGYGQEGGGQPGPGHARWQRGKKIGPILHIAEAAGARLQPRGQSVDPSFGHQPDVFGSERKLFPIQDRSRVGQAFGAPARPVPGHKAGCTAGLVQNVRDLPQHGDSACGLADRRQENACLHSRFHWFLIHTEGTIFRWIWQVADFQERESGAAGEGCGGRRAVCQDGRFCMLSQVQKYLFLVTIV